MAELVKFPPRRPKRKLTKLRVDAETMREINDCLCRLVSTVAELKSVLDKALESRGV